MIDIIYRLCEAETDGNIRPIRPTWYNKFACLHSFFDAVERGSDNVHSVTFVHDGAPGKLFQLIHEWKFRNKEIIKIEANDNHSSLMKCYDLSEMMAHDLYFVEDDYLHMPESINVIVSGIPELGICTGYDHLDRYTRNDDLTFGHEYIIFDPATNIHWRSAESTCCTFAVNGNYWKKVLPDARRFGLRDRDFFRSLLPARLWTPIPGVITQVDGCMSPGVDWEKFNKIIITNHKSQAMKTLKSEFEFRKNRPSDINEHLQVLSDLASQCDHITELGVCVGNSTVALLHGKPKRMISYDIQDVWQVDFETPGTEYTFNLQNDLTVVIEETDLLFIDTDHNFYQLTAELVLHGNKARKFIAFHDTVSYPELNLAIDNFLKANPHWVEMAHYTNNNGLKILKRNEGTAV